MQIHDDHLYHGAALIQIAEHPQFTAINALKISGDPIRVAYRINDDIAVYLKYATKPNRSYDEYIFTFGTDHLKDLSKISQRIPKWFVALVCVKSRQICGLHYSDFLELINNRVRAFGGKEDTYTIIVTVPEGKSLRVYVNAPGQKKTILNKEKIIKRNSFPNNVFL